MEIQALGTTTASVGWLQPRLREKNPPVDRTSRL